MSSVTELVLPNKDGGEVTPEVLSLTFLVHTEPELIIAELRLLHGLLLLEPGVGRSALLPAFPEASCGHLSATGPPTLLNSPHIFLVFLRGQR